MREYLELIMNRAREMGLIKDSMTQMIDITYANKAFNIDWKSWYEADDINFAHDFVGISNNIDRAKVSATHKATADDFNLFVPRFAR